MDLCNFHLFLLDSKLQLIIELLDELRELRGGHFADVPKSTVLNFLTSFYLPDKQIRFVPIKSSHLSAQRLLTSRVDTLVNTPIESLLKELTKKAKSHEDNHCKQQLYIALNSLLKPICKPLLFKKKPFEPFYFMN